jgi:hypothetical protein
MCGAGTGLTVTVAAALVAEQPAALVTVTEYEPLLFAVIDGVVAPFDQRYDAPLDAVSVTLPPAQKVVGPLAVIVATGAALTVTAVGADVALQPFALVTVTRYKPPCVTTIDRVVAPVVQR